MHRLRDAVYRHSMQRLTQTFMTLSLADVSFRVNLRSAHEAELYIRNMVYVRLTNTHQWGVYYGYIVCLILGRPICRLSKRRFTQVSTRRPGWCPSRRAQRVTTPKIWPPTFIHRCVCVSKSWKNIQVCCVCVCVCVCSCSDV